MPERALAVRGISYLVDAANADDLRRDLTVVADDLHCTAVMLVGGDERLLVEATRAALDLGLDVYVRPHVPELRQPKLLDHLAGVARAAEDLRRDHPGRVTLLVGSEFSHTAPGIVPGPKSFLRLKLILRFHRALGPTIDRRLDRLLRAAVATARRHFHGELGYAAAGWEHPDWSMFDFVGVSLYRSRRNQATYAERLRSLVREHGKPVVVTEFGCGAFVGADQRGAGSFQIVDWFATPPVVRADHPRDEAVQARYLGELIDEYTAAGVHGCFVFTFAMPDFPRRDDPQFDLDRAGFGVVAVADDGTVTRKAAFGEVARRYRELR